MIWQVKFGEGFTARLEMENESDAKCVEAYSKWKLENPDRL